jgi:phosphoenolpyruvate-protein kinase (PTS system EI component)
MKKIMITTIAGTLLSAAILTSCNSPAKKVENAQENVTEAKEDLAEANKEYREDMEKYRLETAEKIEANNKSLAEFNDRIKSQKMTAQADYKKKIAEHNADGKENWENFKTEFNRDMEELGKAFKDLTVKNIK